MDDILPSTSTEIESEDSEDISEFKPEPVANISKPLNVRISCLL